MDSVLELIRSYGPLVYVLLFAYCALKSGALPLFAGYAVQAGALDPAPVVAAVFGGAYLGDELRFALARRYGADLFATKPRLLRALNTARALMVAYGPAYIFLYRYPKGMRTIGALPVGLGPLPWARFTVLNGASAAVWTFALLAAGYVFGARIEQAVADGWGPASVALLALMLALGLLAWWRINRLARSQAVLP